MKKYLKGAICSLLLCTCAYGLASVPKTTTHASNFAHYNALYGTSNVTISNTTLRNKLCELLGKNIGDPLKSDDFLNNAKYKAIYDEDTLAYSAEISYLDLSNIEVKDITELCQFEFPTTLKGIHLSHNNIANEDLANLNNFLSLNTNQSTVVHNSKTLTIRSDFDTLIKKVNLCFNKLDLDDLSSEQLNNTIYLYGAQNIPEDSTKLYQLKDLSSAKYYIREDDQINGIDSNDNFYLSYNFFRDTNPINSQIKKNIVSSLFTQAGSYNMVVASVPASPTSYFHGLAETVSVDTFTIKTRDGFTIERKTPFAITKNDIEVTGIGDYKFEPSDISPPSKTGINQAPVRIVYNNRIIDLGLDFMVVDTTAPIITLEGYNLMLWPLNKPFQDPGFECRDSGDRCDISPDYSDLKIDKVGTYTIRYNYTDASGNPAEEKVRTVVVQENTLSEITVSSSNDKFEKNKDIVLFVKPADNIAKDKYKDFTYDWYRNGQKFLTTTGDNNGQSSTTITIDNQKEQIITVKLTVTQTDINAPITIDSAEFVIKCEDSFDNDSIITIATTSAVMFLIAIIATVTIIKYKKAHNKTHRRIRTKYSSKDNSKNDGIQVIKNYNGNKPKDNDKK